MTSFLVLRAVAAAPPGGIYGQQIMRRYGLLSGATYPVLPRLERLGLIQGAWEAIDRHEAGRPARCYYSVTQAGLDVLEEAAQRYRLIFGEMP